MVKREYLRKSLRPGKPFGEQIRALSRQEALKVVKKQSETKSSTFQAENLQLYHDQAFIHYNMLYTTHGTESGDKPGVWTNRIGDEIYLNNVNLRFHLFNKQDRPNVHYRIMMFWYEAGQVPTINGLIEPGGNPMIALPNRESISVVLDKTFSNVHSFNGGKEMSKVVRLNKSWKNKKIVYNDENNVNSHTPKLKDLGFMVLCYDAFGTLITDNIASFAVEYNVRFKEN